MRSEREKAEQFIEALWDNATLSGLSPLQKEEQLLQFLEINSGTLLPALTSPSGFPDSPWSRIFELLKESLSHHVDKAFSPFYETILEKKIDFSFTVHMTHRTASPSTIKKQLGSFLHSLSHKMNSRKELAGPVLGVASGITDRYIEKIFQKPRYICFELRKVQRLKITPQEVANLVKTTMLLRPSVQYFTPDDEIQDTRSNVVFISPDSARKVTTELGEKLAYMPEAVVKSGVNSSLSFQDNPYMESTARLAAIFSHRCRNMKSGMQIDRGAESSDKSWFSVAQKNYRFYGFDLDMLMELLGIAAENGW